MTLSAWIMLGLTWAVIAVVTVRLFIKVLRIPDGRGNESSSPPDREVSP